MARQMLVAIVLLAPALLCVEAIPKAQEIDYDAKLKEMNDQLEEKLRIFTIAQWNQGSNITEEHEKELAAATKVFDAFRQDQYAQVQKLGDFSQIDAFKRRQLEKIGVIGTSALDTEDADKFQRAQQAMETTYSTATVTAGGKPNLSLEPDLYKIMAESTDEKLLREVWKNWHDATGPKMRDNYITYFQMGNKAAQKNSVGSLTFKTFDDLWMFSWETTDLKEQVDKLLEQLKPLYLKIHAYVRHHLTQKYGKEAMPKDGTIPAHLLGNMWAQQWSNILSLIPDMNPTNASSIDAKVNEKLKNKEAKDLFLLSEAFFHDLGMEKMTNTFWEKTIMEKHKDGTNMTCHASAWDFYSADKQDFRIKQCTEKNMNDLITVHHEMGHIQYFMNYAHQPVVYREGANPGFHEAIGDLIALSVATPKHLVSIDLLDKAEIEGDQLEKINLNYQMKMALEKIVFLPFSYVMDKWRWDVFANDSMVPHMNRHWWELRIKHQGVSPPVSRSEKDFDPGSKYHIPAGVEYVRYFVSHVLQFQFYQTMCENLEHKELYECDFNADLESGKKLIDMLRQGSAEKWPKILKDFTGSEEMSLDALKEYFKPLNAFLDNFLKENNLTQSLGWKVNVDDYMTSSAFSSSFTLLLFVFLLSIPFISNVFV